MAHGVQKKQDSDRNVVGHYRLNGGRHQENGVTYIKGDIIASESYLERLNGPGDSHKPKFTKVSRKLKPTEPENAQPYVEPEPDLVDEEDAESGEFEMSNVSDNLDEKTVPQLLQLAADNEIEIPSQAKKAEIIQALRDAKK